jgi:hypothetical protein
LHLESLPPPSTPQNPNSHIIQHAHPIYRIHTRARARWYSLTYENITAFLPAFAGSRKSSISFVTSVCRPVRIACINSAPTGRISMKFDISDLSISNAWLMSGELMGVGNIMTEIFRFSTSQKVTGSIPYCFFRIFLLT